MALEESTKSIVGELLHVEPIHGWGWSSKNHGPIDVPVSFNFRVVRLFSFDGALRGGVGVIEQAEHEYSGCWLVFATRHQGVFNFTDNIGHYNVTICFDEPKENERGWPISSSYLNDNGFGIIRAIEP